MPPLPCHPSLAPRKPLPMAYPDSAAIESFLNDEDTIDMPDYESLTECFQAVWQGFYCEILSINDGEYFLLSIAAHESYDWNIGNKHPQSIPTTSTSLYRYETLATTLNVLAAFQRFTITA